MKIKSRKTLSLLLAAILMLSIFSGCEKITDVSNNSNAGNNEFASTENKDISSSETSNTDNAKWVLTCKKTQSIDTFSNQWVNQEFEYRYDSAGRLTYEKNISDNLTEYTSYDYSYDSDGNVISKSMKRVDQNNFEDISHCTYQYDANGNCIKETILWPTISNTQTTSEYEYDENGNVIKEHNKYENDAGYYEFIKTGKLTYKNNQCIQSEITVEYSDGSETDISYSVCQFTYDINGNMECKNTYAEIAGPDAAENPVEINGKYYILTETTNYTYEKLEDVATDAINAE